MALAPVRTLRFGFHTTTERRSHNANASLTWCWAAVWEAPVTGWQGVQTQTGLHRACVRLCSS